MASPAEDHLESSVLEDLVCDICGKHICWVYDFDLNENYFYCDKCKEAKRG